VNANDTHFEYVFTGALNFTVKEIEVFEIENSKKKTTLCEESDVSSKRREEKSEFA
jgi:hypothetical protein